MQLRYALAISILVLALSAVSYHAVAEAQDAPIPASPQQDRTVYNADGSWTTTRSDVALPSAVRVLWTCRHAAASSTLAGGAQETTCETTGYTINDLVRLNTTNYACNVMDDGKLYVTCDSIYDGNGDGICTSGETCIQFGIVGAYVIRTERNSQDDWVERDASFFLAHAEVTP